MLTPLTTVLVPAAVPVVATAMSLLLHVPPPVVLLSVVTDPAHNVAVPLIAAGAATTDVIRVAIHPVLRAYVILVVPVTRPLTTPVVPSMVATVVLLLLHVPPAVVSVSVVVPPTHTPDAPVIAPGVGLTVTTAVRRQPLEML